MRRSFDLELGGLRKEGRQSFKTGGKSMLLLGSIEVWRSGRVSKLQPTHRLAVT